MQNHRSLVVHELPNPWLAAQIRARSILNNRQNQLHENAPAPPIPPIPLSLLEQQRRECTIRIVLHLKTSQSIVVLLTINPLECRSCVVQFLQDSPQHRPLACVRTTDICTRRFPSLIPEDLGWPRRRPYGARVAESDEVGDISTVEYEARVR